MSYEKYENPLGPTYEYPFFDAPEAFKIAVWQKGSVIPGQDPSMWRTDVCGTPMKFTDHGNTSAPSGWEIDHIHPRAAGGQPTLDNLQPLYWRNNRVKADQISWDCTRKSTYP